MISTLPSPRSVNLFKKYAILTGVLFLTSILVKKGDDILFINGNHTDWADWFFKSVTHLGDGSIIIPCTLLLVFVKYKHAISGLVAAVINGVLIALFKQILFKGVPRPKGYLPHELIHFVDGVSVYSKHSFPSGHTATAFCFAFIVSYVFRNNRITLFMTLYALTIGYSRIYLAQHFLADVAAGAIVGTFSAAVACFLFEMYRLPGWMNQRFSLTRRSSQKRITSLEKQP